MTRILVLCENGHWLKSLLSFPSFTGVFLLSKMTGALIQHRVGVTIILQMKTCIIFTSAIVMMYYFMIDIRTVTLCTQNNLRFARDKRTFPIS